MNVHWWHEGKSGELEVPFIRAIEQVGSPVPIHAQMYIPHYGQWYHLNTRNRVVPVPVGACPELRAMLLLMGISV